MRHNGKENIKTIIKMDYKSFRRSTSNKVIAGVCGGLGDLFGIDPIIFRIIFLLLCAGGGLIIYIIIWILTPKDNEIKYKRTNFSFQKNGQTNISDSNGNTPQTTNQETRYGSLIGGLILVVLGSAFLFNNYFHIDFNYIWPTILIAIGVVLLIRALNNKDNE